MPSKMDNFSNKEYASLSLILWKEKSSVQLNIHETKDQGWKCEIKFKIGQELMSQ